MKKQKILITGAAGFIGFSFCEKLLEKKNVQIIGIDNFNAYYSLKLKKKRIRILKNNKNFKFLKIDLFFDKKKLNNIFKKYKFDIVYNFAAQAGVRYSYENPHSYCDSNIIGFNNIIECIKKFKINKFYFASSSSVYGDIGPFPKKETSQLHPLNIYSLSKLANEQIAKTYSKKIKTSIIGLRFFSIYGEWGRPDMLILKYLIASKKRKPFELFNYGNHYRDFTYIKDAVNLVLKLDKVKLKSNFEIFNVCSSNPLKITKIIDVINKEKIKTKIIGKPIHNADVLKTYGNNSKIVKSIKNFKFTEYRIGVANTINWYLKNLNLF